MSNFEKVLSSLLESEAHKEVSEGYDAYHDGIEKKKCPYKEKFKKEAWIEGWENAEEDDIEENGKSTFKKK